MQAKLAVCVHTDTQTHKKTNTVRQTDTDRLALTDRQADIPIASRNTHIVAVVAD